MATVREGDLKTRHSRTFIQNLLEFDIPHTLPVAETHFLGHKVVKFLKEMLLSAAKYWQNFKIIQSSNYLIHGSYQALPVDIFLINTHWLHSCTDIASGLMVELLLARQVFDKTKGIFKTLSFYPSTAECLLDSPRQPLLGPEELPGQSYDAVRQCRLAFGPEYTVCPGMDVCSRLWCAVIRQGQMVCLTKKLPAVEGTPCGKGRICLQGKCVDKTRKRHYSVS